MKTTINYGVATPNPEAHITRTKEKNRGRLKIYSTNTVYLDKQEEFELELFNTTTENILAKVEINGTLISNNGLVLKPAQRVFLERYFDVDRRFKFDVYEVENWEKLKNDAQEITNNKLTLDKELNLRQQLLNLTTSEDERKALELKIDELKTQTEEMKSLANDLNQRSSSVQQATKYNGKVKILFYKESKPTYYNSSITLLNSKIGTNSNLFSTCTTSNVNIGGSLRGSSTTTNLNTPLLGTLNEPYTFSDNLYSSNSINTCCTMDMFLSDDVKSFDTKETGRIEQGSISNQKFETVNMNFESYAFHTTEYTLLPISDKPLEMKDLRQYCKQCGKKLSPSDNFCSSCGTKA